MEETVHRQPLSAWNDLCQKGGIELRGRDEGLDLRILEELNPIASSLEEALATATMEAFAGSFFKAIGPFVAMFRDILGFFENADATQGKDQWTLRLDEIDLDLDHFRQQLAHWTGVAHVTLEIPAIDSRGIWRLREILSSQAGTANSIDDSPADLLSETRNWLRAYDQGNYSPLPALLTPPQCPLELRVSSSIVQCALLKLSELRMTRQRINELVRSNRQTVNRSDALDFSTLVQNEHDRWLRSMVDGLSRATVLSKSDLQQLGHELDKITQAYPTRPYKAEVGIADLESVLSLPIWKQRNELYAVWVATEMVRALGGHDVELHHDDGRIVFAFRETAIATIRTSPGPFVLISERKSPLENPQGKSRKANVQPDYAFWTRSQGLETCCLVVEVKHYKKSAHRSWIDVFEDYARALPDANVYLVNYGPGGRAVDEVSSPASDRCHTIELLTPFNAEARQRLAEAVRECVGEPIEAWPKLSVSGSSNTAIVLDVSPSMRPSLNSPAMEAFVKNVARLEGVRMLVAVDTAVVGSWPPNEDGFEELLRVLGTGTNIRTALHNLAEYDRLVIITDDDGESTMTGIKVAAYTARLSPPDVRVFLFDR